ncbi:MAG: hypothetical protein IPM29_19330 [Planctomycetes bacterium]|nr:hypothetical protein [Planctomycetota bacterium]
MKSLRSQIRASSGHRDAAKPSTSAHAARDSFGRLPSRSTRAAIRRRRRGVIFPAAGSRPTVAPTMKKASWWISTGTVTGQVLRSPSKVSSSSSENITVPPSGHSRPHRLWCARPT